MIYFVDPVLMGAIHLDWSRKRAPALRSKFNNVTRYREVQPELHHVRKTWTVNLISTQGKTYSMHFLCDSVVMWDTQDSTDGWMHIIKPEKIWRQ